jgi:hypothetical protein
MVHEPAGVQVKNELQHKVMIWESAWEASKHEEKKYVVDLQHDKKTTGTPIPKG